MQVLMLILQYEQNTLLTRAFLAFDSHHDQTNGHIVHCDHVDWTHCRSFRLLFFYWTPRIPSEYQLSAMQSLTMDCFYLQAWKKCNSLPCLFIGRPIDLVAFRSLWVYLPNGTFVFLLPSVQMSKTSIVEQEKHTFEFTFGWVNLKSTTVYKKYML